METTLGETARTTNPKVIREHGEILLAHLDHDGREPTDPPQRRNTFGYTRGRDGWMLFQGQLEPDAAELLQHMLDRDGQPQHPGNGITDDRSPTERFGDVVAEIVHQAADPQATPGRTCRC